jgi:hypothetical protein
MQMAFSFATRQDWLAQGFSQVKGIDFGETFAPIAHLESICTLLAYASRHNFKLQ